MEARVGVGVDVGELADGDYLGLTDGAARTGGVEQDVVVSGDVDGINATVKGKEAHTLSGRAVPILVDIEADDTESCLNIHGQRYDVLVIGVADGLTAATDDDRVLGSGVAKGHVATALGGEVDIAVDRGVHTVVVRGVHKAGSEGASGLYEDRHVAVKRGGIDHIQVAAAVLGHEDGGVTADR